MTTETTKGSIDMNTKNPTQLDQLMSTTPLNINTLFNITRTKSPQFQSFAPRLKSTKASDIYSHTKKKMHGSPEFAKIQQMARTSIVHIKSFNNIKRPQRIIEKSKSAIQLSPTRNGMHQKQRSKPSLLSPLGRDLTLSLNVFMSNKAKYNPLAKIEKKNEENLYGDESSIADLAFLTAVDLKEEPKPKSPESPDPELNLEVIQEDIQPPEESGSRKTTKTKKKSGLKSLMTNPQMIIESNILTDFSSKINSKGAMSTRRKLYISFKTNKLSPLGKIINPKEHLMKIYNRENKSIPNFALPNSFSPKKDRIKDMIGTYMRDYNHDALSKDSYGFYTYLKEKAERENKDIELGLEMQSREVL